MCHSRRLGILALCATVLLCIASSGIATASSDPGETKLVFLTGSGGIGNAMRLGVQLFNQVYDGVYEVEQIEVPYEDQLNQLLLQFVSGRPTFDVFTAGSSWWQRIMPYIEPLDDYIARHNLELAESHGNLPDAYRIGGKQLGLPVRAGVTIQYYRKDLLDQAGLTVPTTLPELEEAVTRLTSDSDGDGVTDIYGFSWTLADRRWVAKTLTQLLFAHGYRLLTDDFDAVHPDLDSHEVIELLEFMRRLDQAGTTPSPLAWTYQDNVVALQQGRIAITWEDSVRVGLIEDSSQSTVAGLMGYSVIPHAGLGPEPIAYEGGGHALGIPRATAKKEAAFEFIQFMIGFDAQKRMALEGSNGPTHLAVYDLAEYHNPAKEAIKEALATGTRFVLPVPAVDEIQRELEQAVDEFMLGRIDATTLLDRVRSTLKERVG